MRQKCIILKKRTLNIKILKAFAFSFLRNKFDSDFIYLTTNLWIESKNKKTINVGEGLCINLKSRNDIKAYVNNLADNFTSIEISHPENIKKVYFNYIILNEEDYNNYQKELINKNLGYNN